MTSINFISTTSIATSTIRSQELNLFDSILNSNVQIASSNGILLVDNKQVQGGGAGSVSSISTYQLFASTLQLAPVDQFDATALFTFDCIGSGRFTDLVSTTAVFTSTIQSQELKLFDPILNSTVQIASSNGVLLVDNKQIQGGAGSVSSISTYQLFASTLQLAPVDQFDATALFTFDCIGSGRFTDLVSTSRIFFGSQFLGIQFG